jgi:hypothetical protein
MEKSTIFSTIPLVPQRPKQHVLTIFTNAKYRWGASVAQLDRARH